MILPSAPASVKKNFGACRSKTRALGTLSPISKLSRVGLATLPPQGGILKDRRDFRRGRRILVIRRSAVKNFFDPVSTAPGGY